MKLRAALRFFVLFPLVQVGLSQSPVVPMATTDQNRSGSLPFSSSVGTSIEHVDLASGALQLHIPLLSVSAHGVTSALYLNYASNLVDQIKAFDSFGNPIFKLGAAMRNGWQLNASPSTTSSVGIALIKVTCSTSTPNNPRFESYHVNTIAYDSVQSQHTLISQNGGGQCGGPIANEGLDGNADGWSYSNSHLINPDGTGASDPDGGISPNGNSYSALTDPLNRPLYTLSSTTNPDGSPTNSYTYYDSNGIPRTIVIVWETLPWSTNFGTLGDFTGGSLNVVASVTLGNGQQYTFHYEPGWDNLSEVDLPAGGKINYTYANTNGAGDCNDPDYYSERRYVTSRLETVGGITSTWNISIPPYGHCSYATAISTVTYPDQHQSVISSTYGSITDMRIYPGSAQGNPLREYQVGYYSDTNPKFDNCIGDYNPDASDQDLAPIGMRLASVETILENGLHSRTEYDYDSVSYQYASDHCSTGPVSYNYTTSRGDVTEIREYDWGNGAPGPLLRRTDKTYLHISGPNASAYASANIVDKVISSVVRDGAGNVVAQAQYGFDDYSPSDGGGMSQTSNAPGHDYVNFSSANTLRGNLTQVKKWLNTTGSWLTTSFGYDDLGNIVSSRDPNGNSTAWSYSDRWAAAGSSTCLPAANSYAFPTQTVMAAGTGMSETSQTTYYPCTSLVQAVQDPNDLAAGRNGTTWVFDAIGRPTQKNLADGGQQQWAYTDTVPTSVSVTTLASPDPSVNSFTAYDNLGRTTQTQLTSDPAGTDIVYRTYDGMGRAHSVSNPYRSTSDSTYGVTTYTYDALNRKTLELESDNVSQSQWSYLGNCVTFTDEAHNARVQCSDALGRLTRITEPGSLQTVYAYDALNNLMTVTQSGTSSETPRIRRFTYDSLSRLITATNPEIGTVCYGTWATGQCTGGYDGNGNLLYKTDARGITTNYIYDALNRLTSKSYSGTSAQTATLSSCYQYDSGGNGNGNLIGRLVHEWTTSVGCASTLPSSGYVTRRSILAYDAMGRPLSEQQCHRTNCTSGSVPYDSTMRYDLAGHTISLWNDVHALSLGQSYDSAGRLVSIGSSIFDSTHPANLFSVSSFTPFDAIQNMTLGTNINVMKSYDDRLRPTGETASHP
jgi:YD repeat-containing protein